jgi:S-DNA-T family DNA segregation ATPase FtsK/SpoIIIE
VASQVDSRTIIDIAGAEKLIGKGDMLFAPVGSAKPMRVQGAFVHESDVEKIVEFIKANNRAAKYNEEFINRIEEEAAKCTAGKKGAAEIGGDGSATADGLDPKFRAAVEVAVESGKISTSLLQRKLEIGYGRAAKIIDQMEEMGYVSAPEGNKPRKILITKEDFMQMVVNDEIE